MIITGGSSPTFTITNNTLLNFNTAEFNLGHTGTLFGQIDHNTSSTGSDFGNGSGVNVGVRKRLGLNKYHTSDAMPSTGSYRKGDFVFNSNPSVAGAGGSQYVIIGWKRLVTGTAHILNTDWVEMRGTNATTGKWDEAQLGGVVSLGTFLTDERYHTTEAAVSGISDSGGDALFLFEVTDYDDGDQVVGSGFEPATAVNNTFTIEKVSTVTGKLTESDGTTLSWVDVGSASDTGTFTFKHLGRGYSLVNGVQGITTVILNDVSADSDGPLYRTWSDMMSIEAKVVHDTSGAVGATVTVYGTEETSVPSVDGTPLVTFTLSGTDEDRASATVQCKFTNIYAVVSGISSANVGVTCTVKE